MGVERLRSLGRETFFEVAPTPYALVDPDLRVVAANAAFRDATLRAPAELDERPLFDAFPEGPGLPGSADRVRASLAHVLERGEPHTLLGLRYDIPDPRRTGGFVRRTWTLRHLPVRDGDGRVAGVLHHVLDVTELWTELPAELRSEDAGTDGHAGSCDPAGDAEDLLGVLTATVRGVARSHRELAAQHDHLRCALASRPTIDQAKGIIMAQRRCGPDEAFAALVRVSQDSNVPLREIAASLVRETSADPTCEETGRSAGK